MQAGEHPLLQYSTFFERTSFRRATTQLKHIKNVLEEEARQVVISDIWS